VHISIQTKGLWGHDAETGNTGKENMKIVFLEKVTFIVF
jgi:hypothetical protein